MAGLPRQLVNVPFAGGLDQKTDPWLIQPGKQTNIVNGVFTKQGQIRKRFGMQSLPRTVVDGASIKAGKRIFFHQDEQLSTDGENLFGYSPAINSNINIDQLPRATVSRAFLYTDNLGFSDPDVGTSGDVDVYAWMQNPIELPGKILTSVIDSSGTTLINALDILGPTDIGLYPHISIVGTTAIVTYKVENDNTVRGRTMDISTSGGIAAGWGTEITLVSSDMLLAGVPNTGRPYDVTVVGTDIVVVYWSNVQTVRLRSFDASLNPVVVFTDVAFAVPLNPAELGAISVMGTLSEAVYVGFSYLLGGVNYNSYAVVCDPVSLLPSSAPFLIFTTVLGSGFAVWIGICRVDATTALFLLQTGIDESLAPSLIMQKVTSASAATGDQRQQSGYVLTSRPFEYNGHIYATVQDRKVEAIQASTFIVDTQHDVPATTTVPAGSGFFRAVATVAPRITSQAGVLPRSLYTLCSAPSQSASVFLTCGSVAVSADPAAPVGLARLSIEMDSSDIYQPAELGEELHLSAGTPVAYDGRIAQEIGFFNAPDVSELLGASPAGVLKSNVGGGLSSGVLYQYQFIFSYRDARGQLHQSTPSETVGVQFAGGTTNMVTFTLIPYLHLSDRFNDTESIGGYISLVVYRTSYDAGTTTMSATLYQLNDEAHPVINDPTGQTFTFVDDGLSGTAPAYNYRDVDIQSHPFLYTTGGTLANVCPPTASLAHVHKNRVWLAGTDEPNTIWYSKQFVNGDAVSFCDEFTLSLNSAGPITALSTLDDKLIIYKKTSIFVVVGDGPPDNGVGDDLSDPQQIASDVGCISARSTVLTPQGLMFQSAEGIMLLSRKLEVSYIGHPVEDTLQAYPVITSAIIVGAQSQVRFTCQASKGSSSGVTLVYDYVQDAWTIFDVLSLTSQASAALSPEGIYATIETNGTSLLEKQPGSATAFLDNTATWVSLLLESAWIKTSGVLGFQRVRRVGLLGNSVTNTNLTISLAPDYNTSYLQSHTWVSGDPSFGPPERLMLHVGSENGMHQKCESLRAKVSDAPPSIGDIGNGLGVTLTGLSMEIATKPDMVRLPAGARQ